LKKDNGMFREKSISFKELVTIAIITKDKKVLFLCYY